MGIKELELFTIKIGYSLLVISSNYFLGLGPLRWRAGMQLRVVGVPLACRAAVLPMESCRRTCRWGPGAEPTIERAAGATGVILRSLRSGFRGLRLSLPGPGKPSRPESSLLYL